MKDILTIEFEVFDDERGRDLRDKLLAYAKKIGIAGVHCDSFNPSEPPTWGSDKRKPEIPTTILQ
jgi:hypothetical protein